MMSFRRLTMLVAAALTLAAVPSIHAQADSAFAVSRAGSNLLRLNIDGALVVRGAQTGGQIPATGAGTRLMWYPSKQAFRAGLVEGFGASYWDDATIGVGSVAMGENTRASGARSFAMGLATTASGNESVAFGSNGTASGERSFAVNGTATGVSSVAIGGGAQATGEESLVLGASSIAGGLYSTVLGVGSIANGNFGIAIGLQNSASGQFSIAIGKNARTANRQGSVVIGDGCAGFSSDSVFASANNQFVARGCGGVKFFTSQNLSSGAEIAAGGSSWSAVSDVNRKENFAPVDGEDLLARLQRVPVSSWNYKTQDPSIRHVGPMAQDLFAALNIGESNLMINSIDIDGVNLAGVKALAVRTDSLRTQVQSLTAEKAVLETRLKEMEARLQRVEAALAPPK